MDYKFIYDCLIERAQLRSLLPGAYFEKHHILPRCIGGTDNASNLVDLTPEEHFLAHQLLVKIYPTNNSLKHAARMMTVDSNGKRVGNKLFGWIKRQISESMSGSGNHRFGKTFTEEQRRIRSELSSGKNNAFYGKSHTEETKQKISNANKGMLTGDKNPFYGKTHTKEVIEYLKEINAGENHPRYGKPASNRGVPHTDETRHKMRVAKLGKKLTEEQLVNRRKPRGKYKTIECPHCTKVGAEANMRRYHFNNCKKRDK